MCALSLAEHSRSQREGDCPGELIHPSGALRASSTASGSLAGVQGGRPKLFAHKAQQSCRLESELIRRSSIISVLEDCNQNLYCRSGKRVWSGGVYAVSCMLLKPFTHKQPGVLADLCVCAQTPTLCVLHLVFVLNLELLPNLCRGRQYLVSSFACRLNSTLHPGKKCFSAERYCANCCMFYQTWRASQLQL